MKSPKNWLRRFRPAHKTDIKQVFSGEEIALKDILAIYWERRLTTLILVVSGIIGAIVTLYTTPEVYKSSTTIISQVKPSAPNLQRLRGLAGLQSGAASGENGLTEPTLYPNLVKSDVFLIGLLETPIRSSIFRKRTNLINFLFNHEERNFFEVWFMALRAGKMPKPRTEFIPMPPTGYGQRRYKGDSTIVLITPVQRKAISELRKAITVELDAETGFITVNVELPERRMSAEVNAKVIEELISFATEFEVRKEKKNLEFMVVQTKEARLVYEAAQQRLAKFLDGNLNVVSARVSTKETQLRQEIGIYLQIYKQMALDLEQAKIKLENQTPIYTVFSPTKLPLRPMAKNYVSTIIIFILVSLVVSLFWISVVIIRRLIK